MKLGSSLPVAMAAALLFGGVFGPIAHAAPAGSVAPFGSRGVLDTTSTLVASSGGLALVRTDADAYRVVDLSELGRPTDSWAITRTNSCEEPYRNSTLSTYFAGEFRAYFDEEWRSPTFVAMSSPSGGFFVRDGDRLVKYRYDRTLERATPVANCASDAPFVAETSSGSIYRWGPMQRINERDSSAPESFVWLPDGSRAAAAFIGEAQGVLALNDGIVDRTSDDVIRKRTLDGSVAWARPAQEIFGASTCSVRFADQRSLILVLALVKTPSGGCFGGYRLARLDSNGIPDTTFGASGTVSLTGLNAHRLAVDPGNRIIVVASPSSAGALSRFSGPRGWTPEENADGFPLPLADIATVLRFTSAGDVDATFGGPTVEPGADRGRVNVPFGLDVGGVRGSRHKLMLPIQFASNGDVMMTWPVEDVCDGRAGLTRPAGITAKMRAVRIRAGSGRSAVAQGTYGSVRNLTTGNDTFSGTVGCDVVRGLGGNDRISTGRGRDVIHAGVRGRSIIDAGPGNDLIYPSDITPSRLVNITLAGSGNDIVRGSQYGRNAIVGGPGKDILRGGTRTDVFNVFDGVPGDVVYCTYYFVHQTEGASTAVAVNDRNDRVIRDPGDRTIGCHPARIVTRR